MSRLLVGILGICVVSNSCGQNFKELKSAKQIKASGGLSGTSSFYQIQGANPQQPLFYWTPSIAPCGMAFVSSDKYKGWKGSLLVGSLKFSYLERLIIANQKVVKREKLFEGIGRLRNVKEAPNGELYIAVEGKGIYRIIPF